MTTAQSSAFNCALVVMDGMVGKRPARAAGWVAADAADVAPLGPMLVIFHPDATPAEIDAVTERILATGAGAQRVIGAE